MFVKVVVVGPDQVVEIEISEEDGSGEKVGDGFHGVDGRVVDVVVSIEDEEGGGSGIYFQAHEVGRHDDVGSLLEGLPGPLEKNVHDHIWAVVSV